MSLPFFKSKRDAESFWNTKSVVKVWVPSSRGFIQVPKSGFFWVPKEMKRGLKFRSNK